MVSDLVRLFIGKPLPTKQKEHERLSKTKALAVFSSDALSSVAYATEEILLVLVLLGSSGLSYAVPISLVISCLLLTVVSSYYQTIHAYPAGAGSYNVTRDNLGTKFGLLAAASLLTDYVLTVAVSISAGVVAITSAFPGLLPYRVDLCVTLVIIMALANLRGVRESGTLFSIPTYAFLLIFLGLIVTGLFKTLVGGVAPLPPHGAPAQSDIGGFALILLVLRAFASGCTAMTGVEAVSDGVPAFKKPEAHNAAITLLIMAVLLSTMFVGITYLASTLHIVPKQDESVVSQIGRLVFGGGFLYYALQVATTLILILAANTAFADFPRLSYFLARDGFLPRQMTNLGDRLVFSNGILVLAILASLLMIVFNGNPHHLIPLYAVGVFLSFTLSQAGMVKHWQQLKGGGWKLKAFINGVGAVATGIVLIVIVESKFIHGAWIVLVLLPLLISMFRMIRHHYLLVEREVQITGDPFQLASLTAEKQYKVVIPVGRINLPTLAAVQFARSLSRDVTAVLVDLDASKTSHIVEEWNWQVPDVPLVVLESPYRSVVEPLFEYLETVDNRDPNRGLAVVILPEVVPKRWWHHLLHNQTALLLKGHMLYRDHHEGSERIVINVPYRPNF